MNKSRRITLATLLGGVAAAASFNAFARRGGARMHGPMDVERMLQHLYVEIDATEEQKQRLDPIVRQTMQDLAPVRQNLRAARGEALKILSQERVDASALEALRARRIQLADEASRAVTRGLLDASEVLDPAQRRRLAAHFSRFT
jgi:Spy/CpxP family protein refolding chaperone